MSNVSKKCKNPEGIIGIVWKINANFQKIERNLLAALNKVISDITYAKLRNPPRNFSKCGRKIHQFQNLISKF